MSELKLRPPKEKYQTRATCSEGVYNAACWVASMEFSSTI